MGLCLMSAETDKGRKALCSFAIRYRAVKRVAMLVYHAVDIYIASDLVRMEEKGDLQYSPTKKYVSESSYL